MRAILTPWLIGTLSFSASTLAAAPQTTDDACATLVQNGDLDGALACYRELLTRSPNDLDAQAAIGAILMANGDAEGALTRFDAVLARDPKHVVALNGKGLVLLDRGEREGLSLLERAVEIAPNDLQTVTNYGRVALGAGELDLARQMFAHALVIAPNDVEANLGAAEVELARGEAEGALRHLATAIEADPDDVRANYVMGTALTPTQPAAAIGYLERAAELAPSDPQAWLALGRARFRAGEYRPAGQAFVAAGELVPNEPVVYLEIAKVYIKLDDLDEARESLLAGFELASPASHHVLSELHLHMGVVKQKGGLYAEARTEYEQALALQPDSAIAELNIGVAEHLLGRYDVAASAFRKLLATHPDLQEARYDLVLTLVAAGEHDAAAREIASLPVGDYRERAQQHLDRATADVEAP